MVLILTDESDSTTNDVIDWLNYFQIPYTRINETSEVTIEYIALNNGVIDFLLKIEDTKNLNTIKTVRYKDLTGFWYRRGEIKPLFKKINYDSFTEVELSNLNYYLQQEYLSLVKAMYLLLNRLKHIGFIYENDTNKIYNLYIANTLGLKIPDTLVTSRKKHLEEYNKSKTELITKAARHGGFPLNRKKNINIHGLNYYTLLIFARRFHRFIYGFQKIICENL